MVKPQKQVKPKVLFHSLFYFYKGTMMLLVSFGLQTLMEHLHYGFIKM